LLERRAAASDDPAAHAQHLALRAGAATASRAQPCQAAEVAAHRRHDQAVFILAMDHAALEGVGRPVFARRGAAELPAAEVHVPQLGGVFVAADGAVAPDLDHLVEVARSDAPLQAPAHRRGDVGAVRHRRDDVAGVAVHARAIPGAARRGGHGGGQKGRCQQ
jgi:hypothetical protein